MSKLKPCVMCGGNHRDLMGYDYHKVSCSDESCPISYLALTKEQWNNRVETETEKRLTAIATKHATVNDERYELLEKQKSDIEKMLDQLFKHEKVDAWLVCKMNDMLDDINHQLDKSRIESEKGDGICN